MVSFTSRTEVKKKKDTKVTVINISARVEMEMGTDANQVICDLMNSISHNMTDLNKTALTEFQMEECKNPDILGSSCLVHAYTVFPDLCED